MPSPPGRVAFTVFGLPIMWYGILIAAALALATLVVYKRAWRHGVKPEKTIDFIIICVPAGLIGARLYYVAFNWDYFGGDLLRVVNIRAGGLAVHGGLILGFLAAFALCRLWDVKPLEALDLAAPSVALAQAVGRWGNYFNQEAYGGPTDLPWALAIDGQRVHPTFLYESLWCLLLFLFLLKIDGNRRFAGQTFLLYGMLYSLERFFVEQLRTDSLILLGQFKQAQVFSAAAFAVCLALYAVLRRKEDRRADFRL